MFRHRDSFVSCVAARAALPGRPAAPRFVSFVSPAGPGARAGRIPFMLSQTIRPSLAAMSPNTTILVVDD
ncbi:MAG TPA: hypothetical protein VFO53_04415, partial [Casimicrobiaceae bacterium]|nr:hypothetical protein [Casimicrobiaceae bacterium]